MLVAGAGAVGQWLGLRLLQTGHQVDLLLRPAHAEAIQGKGLEVHGHTEARGHLRCITDPAQAVDTYRAIFLTPKAHATAGLARQVAPLLAPGGAFVALQNGFGNAAKAARCVPAASVAVAVTSHGLTLEEPGRILHAGTGATVVGPMTPESEPAARLAYGMLLQGRLEPEWRDDMQVPVWRKGLLNHAINPVAALHAATNGEVLGNAALLRRSETLLEEAFALSRAAGVAVGTDLRQAMKATLERTADNRCSMVQDVQRMRATEVEQITGFLVRLARRLGYPLPEAEAIYREVKAMETSYLGEAAAQATTRDEAMHCDPAWRY